MRAGLLWGIVGVIVLQCYLLYYFHQINISSNKTSRPHQSFTLPRPDQQLRTQIINLTSSDSPEFFDLGLGAHEFGHKAEENVDALDDEARQNFIEVFLVPHSHCDAGWLKTFDQYYHDEVEKILTTVTEALEAKPHRKFSWVEVAFLEKWWVEQTPATKGKFKSLFAKKQLEFLMGGWVSHDEATVSYMQAINQMTEGHRFLTENFGSTAVPRIGWQIDPFGLSQVTATIFSQMCFDANAAWRTRQGVNKEDFIQQNQLEFVWRGSDQLQAASDVLLHLLPWSYTSPAQFLFEKRSPLTTDVQVKELAEELIDSFRVRAQAYSSNLLMWPWGHDFQFVNAHVMFDNMDKLLEYINSRSEYNIHVKYATPSEYFDALHEQERSYTLVQKDFLPYGPSATNWWTGYYTSRPALKGHCRYLDQIQRSAEMMYSWAFVNHRTSLSQTRWDELFKKLESVRRVQGIMQHHDAITGTMKEHVLQDYMTMLVGATSDTMEVLESASASVTLSNTHAMRIGDVISVTAHPLSNPRRVVLFNNLGWDRTELVQLYIDNPRVEVVDSVSGQKITSSVLPPTLMRDGKISPFRLFFRARVSALGYHCYLVYHSPSRTFEDLEVSEYSLTARRWKREDLPGVRVVPQPHSDFAIGNQFLQLSFEPSGELASYRSIQSQMETQIRKENWEYDSDVKWDNHYTFKSNGERPQKPKDSTMFYVKSPLVEEVEQQFNEELTQRFSVYSGDRFVSTSDFIQPSRHGENYVARFVTSLNTNAFYTDDSGFEMVRRQYDSKVLYSGNYYPTVYSSFLAEEGQVGSRKFSYICDRTHGVTSPKSGVLDVMMHRNALQALGNGEPLDDKQKVEIRSWLLFENHHEREMISMRMNFGLTVLLSSDSPVTPEDAFFSHELPQGLFVMNMERFSQSDDRLTVRLSNLNSQGDRITLPTTLFSHFPSVKLSVEQRTLSMNQEQSNCKRHHWHDHSETEHSFRYGETISEHSVTDLSPLSIRSFFLKFE